MMFMNTSTFEEFPISHRRADDDPVEDEHGWDTYLNNGPIDRHFPVEFATGVVVERPMLRCALCHGMLHDIKGRVRKTAAAAVIEAAALCPDCNDVTGCDVRVCSDGALESLHGLGMRTYAASVLVPAVVRDAVTGSAVMLRPHLDGKPTDAPNEGLRLAQWASRLARSRD
jgi:hypothetical protein